PAEAGVVNGRYLFPGLVAFVGLLAAGWGHLWPGDERAFRASARLFVVAMHGLFIGFVFAPFVGRCSAHTVRTAGRPAPRGPARAPPPTAAPGGWPGRGTAVPFPHSRAGPWPGIGRTPPGWTTPRPCALARPPRGGARCPCRPLPRRPPPASPGAPARLRGAA